jgi:predicted O-methyltransferase YrrM
MRVSLDYLRAVEPKLKRRALIVADNAIQFAAEMRDFLKAVESDPRLLSVLVRASKEKRDGMMVIRWG